MVKKIELTQGKFAIVDEEDFEYLNQFKWNIRKSGRNNLYAQRTKTKNNKFTLMHRMILNVNDSKIQIDHINGDGLDNRKSNLRLVTQAQNNANSCVKINNKTGFKGVVIVTEKKQKTPRFKAQIKINNKPIHLGSFKTPEEAARAYDEAAIKYFGEFARLNYEKKETKK